MNALRVFAAIIIFSISSYLVYDLLANGFSWVVLASCAGGFLAVHYIWPERDAGDSEWFDILEIILDLPYRAIALSLRSLVRIVRSGGIGIDP